MRHHIPDQIRRRSTELESFAPRLVLDNRRTVEEKIDALSQFDLADPNHQKFPTSPLRTQKACKPGLLNRCVRGDVGIRGNVAFSLRRDMDGRAWTETEIRYGVFEKSSSTRHYPG